MEKYKAINRIPLDKTDLALMKQREDLIVDQLYFNYTPGETHGIGIYNIHYWGALTIYGEKGNLSANVDTINISGSAREIKATKKFIEDISGLELELMKE